MKASAIKKILITTLAVFFLLSFFMCCEGVEGADFEKYKLIAEQNIFARYKRITTGDESGGIVMQKKVISLYILRGVVLKEEEKLAFIENEISGEYIRAKVGEDIAGYKVKDIKSGSVVLEKDEDEFNIKVGAEIHRETKEVAVSRTEQVKDESAETNVKSVLPATGEDATLKLMMERRKRELGN